MNSSGSGRENLSREIKLLTYSKTRLQEELSELEKKLSSISEAGKKYEGLRQSDLKENLGMSDLEISRLREEVNIHIADKKKLRKDKQDLVSTMELMHTLLVEIGVEKSTQMKSYDRLLAEKDELLTVTLIEKKQIEIEFVTQSKEQKETSRALRMDLEQLQKRIHEYESSSDTERVRPTMSPPECNESQNSHEHSSSHNMQIDSAAGSKKASSTSDNSKPVKTFEHRATVVSKTSNKAGSLYVNGKCGENTEASPQYATGGPACRRREKQSFKNKDANG